MGALVLERAPARAVVPEHEVAAEQLRRVRAAAVGDVLVDHGERVPLRARARWVQCVIHSAQVTCPLRAIRLDLLVGDSRLRRNVRRVKGGSARACLCQLKDPCALCCAPCASAPAAAAEGESGEGEVTAAAAAAATAAARLRGWPATSCCCARTASEMRVAGAERRQAVTAARNGETAAELVEPARTAAAPAECEACCMLRLVTALPELLRRGCVSACTRCMTRHDSERHDQDVDAFAV